MITHWIINIFILNLFLKMSFSSEPEFEILNENQIKKVENPDKNIKLEIFCTPGQQISITKALMSSYISFINGPKLIDVFSHPNHTKIIKHFTRKRWSPVTKWLDSSLVSSLQIPSFSYNCIGIASKESYELELIVKSLSKHYLIYRILKTIINLRIESKRGSVSNGFDNYDFRD